MGDSLQHEAMARTEVTDADRPEVAQFVERFWHSRVSMSRGKAFYPHLERGFIERRDGTIVALLTFHIENELMELLTLNSTLEGEGIGSSLMLDAIEKARREGCRRILLATTNDRLRAVGFYQRLGFRITAINLGVVDEAREVKPQIPLVGERGVPIHDEIVMELTIEPYLD